MASALNSTNYLVYDLPSDKVTGTWSTDGTVDSAYPLTNIDDERPWKPVVFTVNPTYLKVDFGSAKRVDIVSFIHCNFDAGAVVKVQMNATDSWGGPTVDATVTLAATSEDGFPGGTWLDLTAQTGYTASGLRWLRIEIVSGQSSLLSLGLVRLTKTLRQLSGNIAYGYTTRVAYPGLGFRSEGSVQLGYALGVRARSIEAQFLNISDATFTLLRSWFASATIWNPTLLILDPSVNDAWWVTWGSQPEWALETTRTVKNRRSVPVTWDEVGRGLAP